MPLYIFHLVKAVNISWFTPWIILDHPRFIFKWAFAQSDKLSFLLFIEQWCYVKQSLAILSSVFHFILNMCFN